MAIVAAATAILRAAGPLSNLIFRIKSPPPPSHLHNGDKFRRLGPTGTGRGLRGTADEI
jgi:hypothetical protein